MTAFAWTGVGVASLLVVAFVLTYLTNMVRDPAGRLFLTVWILIGIVAWGLFGAAWLLIEKVT